MREFVGLGGCDVLSGRHLRTRAASDLFNARRWFCRMLAAFPRTLAAAFQDQLDGFLAEGALPALSVWLNALRKEVTESYGVG